MRGGAVELPQKGSTGLDLKDSGIWTISYSNRASQVAQC